MKDPGSIDKELETLWQRLHADAHRHADPLSQFQRIRADLWLDNESKSERLLQPWLSILGFGLDWLAHVHLALNHESEIGPRSPELRTPWALIGAATSFGWALRNACSTGFDTPARSLLRTYVETLFLCLAVLYDRSLAIAYEKADSDQEVLNFWHTQASPKKLHGRIIEIERSLGFDPPMIEDLAAWRRQEYEVMSQSSHLSYLAAGMTCLPAKLESEETHGIGIFGMASANSHRTLGYAARTTWYFSAVSQGKLIGKTGPPSALLRADKEDENHCSIVVGREVLAAATLRHWSA